MTYVLLSRCQSQVVAQCCKMSTVSFNKRSTYLFFSNLNWDNQCSQYLPIDNSSNTNPRHVKNAIFARVSPTPVNNPVLVAYSQDALRLLGIDIPNQEENKTLFEHALTELCSGNTVLPGSDPMAHCYCGYQFGLFSGQLGDGAAILLGEIALKPNQTHHLTEYPFKHQGFRLSVQLKGSGLTPFSREADGRKVLRSSIREFLCSEHFVGLGIPTTRAGCLITSDSNVIRDMLYSGNPIQERCSVLLRISQSFFRFGSFEICHSIDHITGQSGPSMGQNNIIICLANYVIFTLFPELVSDLDRNQYIRPWDASNMECTIPRLPEAIYKRWYSSIVQRTARLIANWQCIGWCHGVMNTDNMSIIGETIDYGPFGFVERYDPDFISNESDKMGRYALSQQPFIGRYNCERLAEAIDCFVNYEKKCLMETLEEHYDSVYLKEYTSVMRAKLGLLYTQYDTEDQLLIHELLVAQKMTAADYTTTFLVLEKLTVVFHPIYRRFTVPNIDDVKRELLTSLGDTEDLYRTASFTSIGGPIALANAYTQFSNLPERIRKDLGVSDQCLNMWKNKIEFASSIADVLKKKIEKSLHDEKIWDVWLMKYTQRLILDATFHTKNELYSVCRKKLMQEINPTVILRNSLAQKAIALAEAGGFDEVRRVLALLLKPFRRDYSLQGTVLIVCSTMTPLYRHYAAKTWRYAVYQMVLKDLTADKHSSRRKILERAAFRVSRHRLAEESSLASNNFRYKPSPSNGGTHMEFAELMLSKELEENAALDIHTLSSKNEKELESNDFSVPTLGFESLPDTDVQDIACQVLGLSDTICCPELF